MLGHIGTFAIIAHLSFANETPSDVLVKDTTLLTALLLIGRFFVTVQTSGGRFLALLVFFVLYVLLAPITFVVLLVPLGLWFLIRELSMMGWRERG